MHTKKQQGNAHIVVIVIIVVAFVAVLGYIFWKNIDTSSHTTPPTKSTAKTESTKKFCLTADKLCFDYPSTWTVSDKVVSSGITLDEQADTVTIKNSSGNAVLWAGSKVQGLGGACVPGSAPTLEVVDTKATSVKSENKYPDETDHVYAVKSIYHVSDKGYAPYIYLTNSATSSKVSAPRADCTLAQDGVFTPLGHSDNWGYGFGAYDWSELIDGQPTDNFSGLVFYPTKQNALDQLNSSDFKQAFNVLLSVRY